MLWRVTLVQPCSRRYGFADDLDVFCTLVGHAFTVAQAVRTAQRRHPGFTCVAAELIDHAR